MFPGARDLQLCYNEARVCATVRQAKQRVYNIFSFTTSMNESALSTAKGKYIVNLHTKEKC